MNAIKITKTAPNECASELFVFPYINNFIGK
jgi:hypothetical protein